MRTRRPHQVWLLSAIVPALAAVTAIAWLAPVAYLFAAPWLAGILFLRRRGVHVLGDLDAERVHARRG